MQKQARARFFSSDGSIVEGKPGPVLPGSSLRGMIRALVEVIGYGCMRWVGASPTFTFRAVAAANDDPLRNHYRDAIGSFGKNVHAGYMKKANDGWKIIPAKTLKSCHWPGEGDYIKIKEKTIGSKDLPGFIRLNSPNYRPQLHRVSFNVQVKTGSGGRNHTEISQIGPLSSEYQNNGVLVCSGNMLESNRSGQPSRRKNHALVLEPDEKATPLNLSKQVIKDYVDSLTPFQQEELSDWSCFGEKDDRQPASTREEKAASPYGCLADGAPVFYIAVGKDIVAFGHCPNFRVPTRMKIEGTERATTPQDFVPPEIRHHPEPDLADTIFGWVEEEGGPAGQHSGRVTLSDAHFESAKKGVWYKEEPIIPHVLSGPKPSTFQHYLVQDKWQDHDPDKKVSLAHYGTSLLETKVRGHKFYWNKGENPPIEATEKELEHPSQLTQITPIKAGVIFKFKVHFENLRPEELGALWWALALPAGGQRTYRHRLGMGKPLGMGSVAIRPTLFITDRRKRYSHLFENGNWYSSSQAMDAQDYIDAFESFVLRKVAPDKKRLVEVERIQTLLVMLEERSDRAEWVDRTRYMEIEHPLTGTNKTVNEYKERPVLPTPQGVISQFEGNLPGNPEVVNQPPVEQSQGRKPKTGEINPGNVIRGSVEIVEANGDVYLSIDGVSSDQFMARILNTDRAGRQYQEDDHISLQVVRLVKEGVDFIAECKPMIGKAPAGYSSGVVKSFGLGANQSYGFIQPDDGSPDVFVHNRQLVGGINSLTPGQHVIYKSVRERNGKLSAQGVSIVEEP